VALPWADARRTTDAGPLGTVANHEDAVARGVLGEAARSRKGLEHARAVRDCVDPGLRHLAQHRDGEGPCLLQRDGDHWRIDVVLEPLLQLFGEGVRSEARRDDVVEKGNGDLAVLTHPCPGRHVRLVEDADLDQIARLDGVGAIV
jgi:hypothetical protein